MGDNNQETKVAVGAGAGAAVGTFLAGLGRKPGDIDLTTLTAAILQAKDEIIAALKPGQAGQGYPPNAEQLITGNVTIAVVGQAYQLTQGGYEIPDGYQLTLVASPANTGRIFIGTSTASVLSAGTRFDGLAPGMGITRRVKNTDMIFVAGTFATDILSWIVEL
jgi:hypothetical protein